MFDTKKIDLSRYRDNEGVITAKIMGMAKGFSQLEGVKLIYLKSKDYQTMIMADFVPTFGRVQGDVTLLTREREIRVRNVDGFFTVSHNTFVLLLKEENYVVE